MGFVGTRWNPSGLANFEFPLEWSSWAVLPVRLSSWAGHIDQVTPSHPHWQERTGGWQREHIFPWFPGVRFSTPPSTVSLPPWKTTSHLWVRWDTQGNRVEVICCCVSPSVMSDSVTPWTVACQAPLSMEFSRQKYWSGWLFPSP